MKTFTSNGVRTEIKCNGGNCETKTVPVGDSNSNGGNKAIPIRQTIQTISQTQKIIPPTQVKNVSNGAVHISTSISRSNCGKSQSGQASRPCRIQKSCGGHNQSPCAVRYESLISP